LISVADRNRKQNDKGMCMSRNRKILSIVAACSAVLLGSTIAVTKGQPDPGAKAIETRQGYMKLVVWEAGPLFGMAKGEIAYDAEAATTHAANLKAISQYPVTGLFLPGTSKADRPGKTVAKPDIWQDRARFQTAFDDWRAAVAALAEVAGDGQPALAAAVGGLGKSCGGCHKPFRSKEF
jgi:cytochrome c556